jgi:hypothetical protein
MLLWHLNLDVPPVVVPGTTTLLIRGFQSGLLVTRGLGVHAAIVVPPITCYPDPYRAAIAPDLDPSLAGASVVVDPFAATATVMPDPYAATSRLRCGG